MRRYGHHRPIPPDPGFCRNDRNKDRHKDRQGPTKAVKTSVFGGAVCDQRGDDELWPVQIEFERHLTKLEVKPRV
ncbi:hypothetical protein MBOU_01880 [Mycobacterium bourgelatii]|uniref:Uncharacterized protein n=1 Tax=Mycobacterium bourgelatii TaxID=1273442 RepID=A0A7I9YHI9_MYCBU|nr:hypothetical protein MBOU_01880 [Mycobacterium bourgelatii]